MMLNKQEAANSSVIAASGLTVFKIVVGLLTGSLGILAEAAHSGLDLMAAGMTALAVRISAKPADTEHSYGHGKAENISAFAEVILLLITCVWVITAAVQRILSRQLEIEVNIWSFTVMVVSIIVDVSRSRMLFRAAKQYNSQALEADALHFSTDIWSSAVVILGLFCVKANELWFKEWEFLHYADAVAAIFVGLIVIKVSLRLGIRSIGALMDTAPHGLERKIIKVVESLPGVLDCHNVRARHSGSRLFIDLHVSVSGEQTLRQAHDLTEEIEAAIQKLVPNADVTVHPEPSPGKATDCPR